MSTIQMRPYTADKNAEEILLHRILAHEMTNNLNLIKFGIDELKGGNTNKSLTLKILENASETIADLFEVYQTGSPLKQFRPTLLEDIILQQLSMLESLAATKNIQLSFKFYDDQIEILGDQSQLGRAIYNLILNSIEASEKGDTITVEAWSNSQSAQMKITDIGKGMSPEILYSMWKPFFTTKKDNNKCHGLGTFIARTAILNHNGSIYAESRISKGTTIHISLPLFRSFHTA